MRIVFIASDPTRDHHRAELATHGVHILTESSDRDNTLLLLPVLQPELVLLESQGQLASTLAWLEQATGMVPGVTLLVMGPEIAANELLAVMRAGVRDYLPTPTTAQVLEAIARARQSARPAAPVPAAAAAGTAGQIAVVYSPKGGVGKSTLAANLAVALHQTTGQRANLVDLGLQFGDQDLIFNMQPQKTLADLVPVSHDMDARILDQLFTPSPVGVRLLASPGALEDGEGVTGDHIARAFEALKGQKGWTVVDCGAHLDEATLRAMELADVVLMPITIDLATIRRVSRAFAALEAIDFDLAKVKLVAWTAKSEIGVADVARTLGRPIAYQLPWDVEGVAAAINQGIPLQIGQPTAPLAQAVRMMAAEIAGVADASRARESGGLMGIVASAFGWLKRGNSAKPDIKLLTAGSGTSQ